MTKRKRKRVDEGKRKSRSGEDEGEERGGREGFKGRRDKRTREGLMRGLSKGRGLKRRDGG